MGIGMKALAIALALVAALPLSAAAGDDFRDLPGVRDPARMKPAPVDTVCTTQLERQHATPYRNGLAYRTYSCRYGDVAVGSDRPPNLIEYRRYKERY
jgi:hypothetical protein